MGAYDRYQLKLGKKTSSQTAPLVKEWADMVLFMNYKTFSVATDDKGKKHKGQGGVRTIYANHHPAWDAKNRHGLPDEFPMDYSYIAHIFNMHHHAKRTSSATRSNCSTTISVPISNKSTTSSDTYSIKQPIVEQPPVQNAPPVTNTVELNPMIPQLYVI